MVFPQHHIDNLNGIFMKKSSNHTSESESRSASPESIFTESQASVPATAAAVAASSTEEPMEEGNAVDGEPLPNDVDGEPMEPEGVDGEPMEPEDVDGVPLEQGDMIADDDLDGEPLQDDDQHLTHEDQQVPSSNDIDDMFAPA